MRNPSWCYVNNGRVKHLVSEVGDGERTHFVAACGFIPVRCWRTTAEAMKRCKECCKIQAGLIKQLEKQIEAIK